MRFFPALPLHCPRVVATTPWQWCAAVLAQLQQAYAGLVCVPADGADLSEQALVEYCGQGRVCVLWDHAPVQDALPLLHCIARRQLPIKVFFSPVAWSAGWAMWADLPQLRVAAPLNGEQAGQFLLTALKDEWPTALLVPPHWQVQDDLEPAPDEWGYWSQVPQEPIWLLPAPDALAIAFSAQQLARAEGFPVAVLVTASLSPLPVRQLAQLNPALVMVVDRQPIAHGFGHLWQRQQPAPDLTYIGAESRLATPPHPDDIVHRLRVQLGV